MSRVLIHAEGTLGDHLPTIALGRALAERGHRVTLAINRAMHEWAGRAGLEAVALPDIERGPEEARLNAWAWDHWHNPDPSSHPGARPMGEDGFVAQARALAALCADADLLLSTSIRFLGLLAQRASGTPWLTYSLNPYSFWRPVDSRELAALRAGSREHHRRALPLLARLWDALELAGPLPEWSHGWHFARHVLLASSPAFSRPDLGQLQPRQSIDQTGFWWYEDPAWAAWRPDPDLEAFCARRPIVLSFSSQPLEDPGPLLARHVEAAALLGMPLLVQRGWAGFSEAHLPSGTDPARVRFADFLPQDWLFARAACSVQHGGVGTIARALRAGCPILVEPFGNDQLYNASRVSLLGAGAAVQPFATTAEGLASVLSEKVLSASAREKAAALGVRIGAERGLEHACQLIEAFLARPGRENPSRLFWQVPALEALASGAAVPEEIPPAARAVPGGAPAIPRVVHQSWRDAAVPDEVAGWRSSWQEQNPGWEVRLWTDEENRELIRRDYAWFLPIYDGYPEAVMRADAARCFVLHRHGGVYADLDCECLRPLGPLLEGRELVLGLEPESHREQHFPNRGGLRPLVSNAWMASVPGQPFWEHVARELVRCHQVTGPLEATGPFLLTRACLSWERRGEITLVPPSLLSPVAGDEPWEGLDPLVREAIARRAFVVHHWMGSWWRGAAAGDDRVGLTLLERGRTVSAGTVSAGWLAAEGSRLHPERPLVSCLMVTKDRAALARRAVGCYQRQEWPARELVIVDDGRDASLAEWVAALGDPGIRHLRLPPSSATLGELRNLALAEARGPYVAQWDDDDLSDPQRLAQQMAALLASGAAACLLERQQLWWPGARRLAVSRRRLWEGSIVAEKAALAPYPQLRRGEDTPVIERLAAEGRVALLDAPHLYVYVFHGGNTFGKEHWEEHWRTATEIFAGVRFEARMDEIHSRMMPESRGGDGGATPPSPATAPEATPVAVPGRSPRADLAGSAPPPVLLLVPVRDAVAFLPRFLENVRALAWPRDRLALAFLEGDSRDGTYDWLAARLPALRGEFARVELFRRDFGLALGVPRWDAGVQRRRRSTLARVRNLLLSRALRDEEWVLWADVDVSRWPPDLIGRLLAPGKRIVVPHCRREGTGETFDLNTFKIRPGTDAGEMDRWVVDGILQPPRGVGRIYLSELQDRDLVEVDGVGGTVLLVSADLHREGLVFPPVPYRRHIETEGLSFLARDMGVASWGVPRLEVWHP